MTVFIVDKLAARGIGVRYGFLGIAGWIEFNFSSFRPARLAMTRAESVSRMRRWLERPDAENIAELYA